MAMAVLGTPGSWQPVARCSTTFFCLDGLEADASISLPPMLRPQPQHPRPSASPGLLAPSHPSLPHRQSPPGCLSVTPLADPPAGARHRSLHIREARLHLEHGFSLL